MKGVDLSIMPPASGPCGERFVYLQLLDSAVLRSSEMISLSHCVFPLWVLVFVFVFVVPVVGGNFPTQVH